MLHRDNKEKKNICIVLEKYAPWVGRQKVLHSVRATKQVSKEERKPTDFRDQEFKEVLQEVGIHGRMKTYILQRPGIQGSRYPRKNENLRTLETRNSRKQVSNEE